MSDNLTKTIQRRRGEAIEILTDPDYFGQPSLIKAAWRFLHQHGATGRGLPARAEA